jgi:hypothetical protein
MRTQAFLKTLNLLKRVVWFLIEIFCFETFFINPMIKISSLFNCLIEIQGLGNTVGSGNLLVGEQSTTSVADPHHIDADPDRTLPFDDADPDPACHF